MHNIAEIKQAIRLTFINLADEYNQCNFQILKNV